MYKDIIILYAHPQDNNMLVNISRVNYLYTCKYVTVKGQATRKKPWRQGKTAPTILQMERKEEKSLRELT